MKVRVLGWLVCASALVGAIVLATSGWWLSAVTLLLGGLLFLPALDDRLRAARGRSLPVSVRPVGVLVLLVALGFANEWDDARLDAAWEERHLATLADDYAERRDDILARMTSALERGEYAAAYAQARFYLPVADDTLRTLSRIAEAGARKQLAERQESELLARLDTVGPDDVRQRRALYSRLSRLRPQNESYRDALERYSADDSSPDEPES